ncbi:BRO family protein [Phascolarctobacterium sp.]|uniref:BRO-N domain-containing protein n=1 Tax=Phascolarctobacterium sp. TaxID=2049039 RepID=UPI0025E2718D|nr:BRO family protein [Phascolarctobacterium sp.]
MEEIKIISKSTFLDKEIDVWGSVENPLFRANDVQNWLGLKNVSRAVANVDEEERLNLKLSRGGSMWFLTEEGIYELLMQSRKPIAKQFKKGVKAILHEIRTKGGYIASSVNDTPEPIIISRVMVLRAQK